MTDLIGSDSWSSVYQFELTDLIQGGPGGIDNRPTQELTNRTERIKTTLALAGIDVVNKTITPPSETTVGLVRRATNAEVLNGSEILTAFVNPKQLKDNSILFASSIVNLRLTTNNNNSVCFLTGYRTNNDGGEGFFIWDSSSVETDNGGTTIQVTGVNTGRWKRVYTQYVSVKWFGAYGNSVNIDTTYIQSALNNHKHVFFPSGNYMLDSTGLYVYPKTYIMGTSPGDYIASLPAPDISGVRLIQTASAPCLRTDVVSNHRFSNIHIDNIGLLGGTTSVQNGTYGVYCSGSSQVTMRNVWAQFFKNDGIYSEGGIIYHLYDCLIKYNQDSGIFYNFGNMGEGPEQSNSYMSTINNCIIHQNKNAGVKLGVSTVRVDINNCDIESQGNYYPTGTGFGVYITNNASTVNINGSWIEGNKIGIVVGDEATHPSTFTIPMNTSIRNCEFWNSTSGTKIKFNAGKNHLLDNCKLFGGQDVVIGHMSDNPLFVNCSGDFNIKDNNENLININNDFVNDFPYSDIIQPGYFTTSNCTIEIDNSKQSPAGNLPVYKITPITTGQYSIDSVAAAYPMFNKRGTFGFYSKVNSTTKHYVWPLIGSSQRYYTDDTNDKFSIEDKWKWISIGRHTPTADNTNKHLALVFNAPDTNPIYISALTRLDGIVYEPYKTKNDLITELEYSFTPSVLGLSKVYTNSGIGTLTNFKGGYPGQELTIFCVNSVTINHNTNIIMKSGANKSLVTGNIIKFLAGIDLKWYEI